VREDGTVKPLMDSYDPTIEGRESIGMDMCLLEKLVLMGYEPEYAKRVLQTKNIKMKSLNDYDSVTKAIDILEKQQEVELVESQRAFEFY
jgi:hypothetical protein